MKNILVTGGAGYIGSHMAAKLIEKKYKVYIVDNLSTGSKKNLPKKTIFYNCDICNPVQMNYLFKKINFDAIFHFAASISVPESEINPKKYIFNNVYGTLNLLDHCAKFKVKKFIFSSTCAVYGSVNGQVSEKTKTKAESNYGKTKSICENIIKDYAIKYSFSYAILRYFNVVGADKNNKRGQLKSQSLFKTLSKNIINKKYSINIFGNNYPTKDKTCIRDYIDINDLVNIHFLSYKKIKKNLTLNCGYNVGYSVKQIISKFEEVSGRKIKIKLKPRRTGDLVAIWSNNQLLKKHFPGWKRKFTLTQSIKNSLNWERVNKK